MKIKYTAIFKYSLLCTLYFLLCANAIAQQYPVRLMPIFKMPYSSRLADYSTSFETKMTLRVHAMDVMMPYKQVRLKMIFEGPANFQSNDYQIQGAMPLYLSGGDLQNLSNVDLAAYFRFENLVGINDLQYASPLPEGMYNVCFEMFDMATNNQISNRGCTMLYLQLNDPPILNIPAKNEQIKATDFPHIAFSWTPRQINATNVSYEFELRQLFDPNIDPQFGFETGIPIYKETDYRRTQLLYDLSKPTLVAGARYAWRVKAVSTSGLSENAVFKNDGYSEIHWFTYAADCTPPSYILSEIQSPKSAKLTWQGAAGQTRYKVQYRRKGVERAEWFGGNCFNPQVLLTDLDPGETYEFRVGATCDDRTVQNPSYVYSNIQEFTQPKKKSQDIGYNCGVKPDLSITNTEPLPSLTPNEVFKANDFDVHVLEIQGNNGTFTGMGYVTVPYLADTKLKVVFNNIKINKDYQLTDGVVVTTYDPEWKKT